MVGVFMIESIQQYSCIWWADQASCSAGLSPGSVGQRLYRAAQLGVPALLGAPAFVLLHRALLHADTAMTVCEPLAGDDDAPA
jgi:hypothetical protein